MKFKEYIKESARTDANLGERDHQHWLLGTYNEFGEAIGPIKKALVKDVEVDKTKLQDELCGDVSWYLAKGCRLTSFSVPDTYAYEEKDNVLDIIKTFNLAWNNEDIMGMFCAIQNMVNMYDLDFEQGLQNNINKLKARHPEGFNIDNEKHTDAERAAIEQ